MLSKYKAYDASFVSENMMGPNVLMLAEELTQRLHLSSGMRILDLGCGKALSSIFLAKEFGATVFATDLWIPAAENYGRVNTMGLEGKVIPIRADAHSLPYAEGFFDAVLSFDLACNAEAWNDWTNSPNPYGQGDRPFFENVKQLATVAVIAKRNGVDYRSL